MAVNIKKSILSISLAFSVLISGFGGSAFAEAPQMNGQNDSNLTSSVDLLASKTLVKRTVTPTAEGDIIREVHEVPVTLLAPSMASNRVKITVLSTYQFDFSKNMYKYSFNLDSPSWINPSVDAVFRVERSDQQYGYYNEVASLAVNDASYIWDHVVYVGPNTGHYRTRVDLKARKLDEIIEDPTIYSQSDLINRTGRVWVFNFVDYTSQKVLNKPPANWARETRHSRPWDLRGDYKKWYDNAFNTTLNLDGYDVHHIRPLFLGGDNGMDNLIHLPVSTHSGVTGWFSGY
ncbi:MULTISPECIES: HNH endonuclease signature motif containing protein [Paenibacillus]|uniref:HNH endonuclease signature motif containing protein n=1 Tax=Paenibacillus oleatilyticus TaxID=2594886 RepID=A0ABV4V3Y5_9BACL|nr:HNH endonuclease signature motif containing protein [Paenibacillus tyrfis]MCP1309605.1 HNH endonuclease [Paenibacillus tyrfis]